MRASSQASLDEARSRFAPVLREAGHDADSLGADLFSVADLLQDQGGLRRALTDPSREGQDKADLISRLLSGKVSGSVLDLVAGMVRGRWSAAEDLIQAVEDLGVDALLASAEADGVLEELESELFGVQRTLADNRPLRLALGNKDRPMADRMQLLDQLFGGKVAPQVTTLLHRALQSTREASLSASLVHLIEAAAQRREQLVVTATAARPLSQAQIDRLRTMVERGYGRSAHINVAVDPGVIGGLHLQIGDEVVDATVLARLDEARRRMAG